MNSADIQQDICNFIVENFLFGKSNGLAVDDSLVSKGVIDSTGILELISFIQHRFGIRMDDQEVIPDNLDSIQSIAGFVTKKLGQA